MNSRHGTAFAIALVALILPTSMIYAAATEERAAEVATEQEGVVFDTYHWATPAEFEQATGMAIGEYNEAPMLSAMVAAGDLPPVEERLPTEPLVVGKKIGKYGGTMYMANPWKAWSYGAEPYSLYGFGIAEHTWTYNIYPNLAESYDMEDGGRAWVIHLREGLKWSDGAPFTADDVVFWWEDITTMQPHPDVFTKHQMETHVYKGVEKIDDYTLRFDFNGPTRDVFFSVQAGKAIAGFPKHYFKQFHPTYADAGDLEALVKDGGFDSWQTLFANKFDQRGLHNTERPVLLPWTLSKGTPGDIIMIRNPYYWVVDPAGNQLPYIDELYRFMELELETINLKALAGELDIARVSMETYNLAKDREGQGKLVAMRYAASDRVHTSFGFNLTHKDPVLREIFRDNRFRFAASYALNREQMNELVFNGLSQPWQDGTPEGDPFYHERLSSAAIEYDPEKANALLDEMGLEKGADGFRRRPDGSKLQITMISQTNRGPGERIAELITDDLKAVGLDINLRLVERSLMVETCRANEIEMKVDDGGAAGMTFSGYFEGHLVPAHPTCPFSPLWQRWGVDPSTGEEPLPAMQEAMQAYRAGFETIDLAERQELWARVADIGADNLWAVGTVTSPGYFKIYSSRLDNWPTEELPFDRGGDKGRPDIYFFK